MPGVRKGVSCRTSWVAGIGEVYFLSSSEAAKPEEVVEFKFFLNVYLVLLKLFLYSSENLL